MARRPTDRRYFNWNGERISRNDWTSLLSDDPVIARADVGEWTVSTVFRGEDLSSEDPSYEGTAPLIFETLAFRGEVHEGDWSDHRYYPTLGAAREGHEEVVARIAESNHGVN